MNWERVKNFLIFLFLGINIFLLFFMFNSVKITSSTSKAVIRDTASILQANSISVDEDIIPYSISNPGSFDAVPINIAHSYDSPKHLKKSNTESEIKKALAIIDVKNFEILKISDTKYSVIQKINGYRVFSAGITAEITDNRISLNGLWYKQKNKPSTDGYAHDVLVYVTSVLIDFINNPDRNPQIHNTITNIDFGYGMPQYDSGTQHVSVPAVPCYCITTADGTSFIYEAASGEYLKNK